MQNSSSSNEIESSLDSKKHVYDYDVLIDADTAPARVIRMVGHGKTVLEVGSGPGSITKILSSHNKCAVTALEVDPAAIKIVKNFCEAVVSADLNEASWPERFNGKKFDCVIAADVLEHVYKPLEVLTGMKSLLTISGEIVVSLPHIGHAGIAACLIKSDFSYRDWGLLDRTHIRFFGLKNIDDLFRLAGLKVLEVQFVVRHPMETEFATIWITLSEKARTALLKTPSTYVYQVVVRATAAENSKMTLDIASEHIPIPKPSIKTIIKQLLPVSIKRALKSVIKLKS